MTKTSDDTEIIRLPAYMCHIVDTAPLLYIPVQGWPNCDSGAACESLMITHAFPYLADMFNLVSGYKTMHSTTVINMRIVFVLLFVIVSTGYVNTGKFTRVRLYNV